MELKDLLEFLFNPVTGKAFLAGLLTGLPLGWGAAFLHFRKEISLLKKETEQKRHAMSEKQAELYDAEAKYQERESQIKALEKRIPKTLACSICGSGMKRIREYSKRNEMNVPVYYVELLCLGDDCGQMFSFTVNAIEQLALSAAKK